MASVARPRRRGILRLFVTLVILVLIVGGALFWLNTAAQAATTANAVLSIFSGAASVSRGGAAYTPATSGTIVKPGDGVQTDAKGRAAIQFPDGSTMRLANSTEITLTSAHFSKDGTLHDASIKEKVGRTFTNVHHLASGSSFNVTTQATTASVRGTKFSVKVGTDGTVLIKLYEGVLDFNGTHLTAGQQATATASGQVSTPVNITPDPTDPFEAEQSAENAVLNGKTTPGSEQTFIGPPLHNGEQQQYGYDYAGTGETDFAVAYAGSSIGIQVTLPGGAKLPAGGPASGNPAIVTTPAGTAGHYVITIFGTSGLGTDGEPPTVAAAASEPCQNTNIDNNGAVRRGWTEQDIAASVSVSGLSDLVLHVVGESTSGAIINASAKYNGASVSGTLVLFVHDGNLGATAAAVTLLGVGVPADQAMQQIASSIGKDPASIDVGYHLDRLYSCPGVLMIDGHH